VQSNISTRDKRTDIVCLDNIIYVSCIDKQRKLVSSRRSMEPAIGACFEALSNSSLIEGQGGVLPQ